MKETGIPASRVYRHLDICSKNCPSQINARGDWTRFKKLISNHSQQEKTRALMEYKLEELTKRVDKHNNVVERTYALEQELKVQEEQIKVANHRINDLEQKG